MISYNVINANDCLVFTCTTLGEATTLMDRLQAIGLKCYVDVVHNGLLD